MTFKASGIRKTGISMAILNPKSNLFQILREKPFQPSYPIKYANLEDPKKLISQVHLLRNFQKLCFTRKRTETNEEEGVGLEHRGCHVGKRQEAVPSRMKKGDFRMTGVRQASKAAHLEGWGVRRPEGR